MNVSYLLLIDENVQQKHHRMTKALMSLHRMNKMTPILCHLLPISCSMIKTSLISFCWQLKLSMWMSLKRKTIKADLQQSTTTKKAMRQSAAVKKHHQIVRNLPQPSYNWCRLSTLFKIGP